MGQIHPLLPCLYHQDYVLPDPNPTTLLLLRTEPRSP